MNITKVKARTRWDASTALADELVWELGDVDRVYELVWLRKVWGAVRVYKVQGIITVVALTKKREPVENSAGYPLVSRQGDRGKLLDCLRLACGRSQRFWG